jgi:hypothetical protein
MSNVIPFQIPKAPIDMPIRHPHDGSTDKSGADMERKDVEIMLETLELKTDFKFERLIAESNKKFADAMADSQLRFTELMAESRLKFSESQTMLAEAESKHAKWVIALAFTMIAFVIGSVGFSTNLIIKAIERPREKTDQSPPIVITMPSTPTPTKPK